MADKLDIHWDKQGLEKAVGESQEIESDITLMTNQRIAQANSIGAATKTGYFYDRSVGKRKGGTVARYVGDVEKTGKNKWPIGIVHPANYAAMLDDFENNTLVKVM